MRYMQGRLSKATLVRKLILETTDQGSFVSYHRDRRETDGAFDKVHDLGPSGLIQEQNFMTVEY